MRSNKILLCSAVFLFLLFCVNTYAEDKKDDSSAARKDGSQLAAAPLAAKVEEAPAVTGTASVGVFSKYIFRGYELSKRSVVIQPAITISSNGFSASFWGNIDSKEHPTQNFAPDREDHKSYNETDLTLSYTRAFGKVSLTGGYIYYGTKYANETEELFGAVSYDTFLKPTLSVYQDISSYPGTYINLSVSQSFPVSGDITLDLGASAGYTAGQGDYWRTYERTTGDYTGSKYSALHDGMVKAGFTIPLSKHVTLQPLLQYWFPLSDKAKRKIDGNSYNFNGYLGTNFVGGATINYNF
jgi:hypothetical protein